MSIVKPFKALRPKKDFAKQVAAPPYDVISSSEAHEMAAGNALSFLHVNKPEIDLDPDINIYDPVVYKKGAENLKKMIDDKIFMQDADPCFYLYRQIMGKHQQIGLVACASVAEYDEDKIKKHELTRIEKEDDRLNHVMHLNAQTGPVFLTYIAKQEIDFLFSKVTDGEPEYDFSADDGIRHTVWLISDPKIINTIESEFATIDYLYVADGHHRSAAASRACAQLADKNSSHSGDEEYNFFLTVIFPHNQMQILDYNRVITDLNGLDKESFLAQLLDKFLVREFSSEDGYRPSITHDFGMYLDGMWYRLSAIPGTWNDMDPIERLDVSILYENILKPILGIGDLRKDKRIDFVGGIRGLDELRRRVDSGEMQVAFALYPTSIEDLMSIADAGKTMPPKSTWFEPKLRSGLLIHLLD
jgi:uncharacterized protein (DUF1015 family)